MRLLAAGILLLAHLCTAFYLPGLAPVNFCEADRETAECKVSGEGGGVPREGERMSDRITAIA